MMTIHTTPSRGFYAARYYVRGFTLRETAKRLGCSHETVRQELIARQIELRPRGRRRRGP